MHTSTKCSLKFSKTLSITWKCFVGSPTWNDHLHQAKIPLLRCCGHDAWSKAAEMDGTPYADHLQLPSVKIAPKKDVQHLLKITFLIKSYELGSKSDGMNQHNFFFPLSLVMLEGKTPVLTLLGKVPVVPVARERLHLIADTNRNSCSVLWGTKNGPTGLWVQSSFSHRLPFRDRLFDLEMGL